MRRIVHAAAVLSAVSLGACGGGGSVFNTGAGAEHTIVTAAGNADLGRVLPGSTLAISATAVSGSDNGFYNANRFIWSAALTTGGTYQFSTDGNATKACATVNVTTGGTTTPYTADFSIYLTIDPTNEANVLFSPPPVIPPPAGSTVATSYPYCVTVNATPVGGNATNTGSITVVVVNPANPLQ